jgi:SAM-dependent methyltransferase
MEAWKMEGGGPRRMTTDEAIEIIRSDPRHADLVRDAYFDRDLPAAARRYAASAEFAEVRRLLGHSLAGSRVADIGSGTGIAAYAFAAAGAACVYAVEPDPSTELGQGAIRRLAGAMPIQIIEAYGEALPLASDSVDVVFARQVLHHTRDLSAFMREAARILKPGGVLLACREHVVDNDDQLAVFLARHPLHPLTGTENAFSLATYTSAIRTAGFADLRTFDPWDSIINAFPMVRSEDERRNAAADLLRRRFGPAGAVLAKVPFVQSLVWRRIRRPEPGRLYSFLATKPRG